MSDETNRVLTLQELPELRRRTDVVSRFLKQQIAGHLETLRPVLAPERVFGKQAGGKSDVPGAERALAELQQNYKAFTRKPFDLPETFELNWLNLVGTALDLHQWEYTHPVQGKNITISSPLRWGVNYRTNYNLAQVKNVLDGQETVQQDYLRQFVVNTLVLQIVVNRNAGLAQLFQDLRYDLKVEPNPALKGLPTLTITSCIASFRPADDLILAATAFSGVPAFIELLDAASVQNPPDLLRERLQAAAG